MDAFNEALHQYCADHDRIQLRNSVTKVHKSESCADDIRREIEVLMYSKSIFPESRGDILILLETMDKVPNQTELVVRMLLNQNILIPEIFCPFVLQLVDVCLRCVAAMLESTEKLFSDFTSATEILGKIDELESEGDRMEEKMIEDLFCSELEKFDKLLLCDFFRSIAMINDRAENVGDRVRIIVAKRSI
jgi:hypothetical protein